MFWLELYSALVLSALLFVEVSRCAHEVQRDLNDDNRDQRSNTVYHVNVNVYSDRGGENHVEAIRVIENANEILEGLNAGNVLGGEEAFSNPMVGDARIPTDDNVYD